MNISYYRDNNRIVMCEITNGEEEVGYCHLEHYKNESVISFINVYERYRRMGFGSYLLNSLLDCLTKDGSNSVRLMVDMENTAAISLYEKYGFKTTHKIGDYSSMIKILKE